MIASIIIGIVLISIMIFGGLYQRSLEKREWNCGICEVSGRPWRRFGTDSQGGRGYTDDGGNWCWISYSVDI